MYCGYSLTHFDSNSQALNLYHHWEQLQWLYSCTCNHVQIFLWSPRHLDLETSLHASLLLHLNSGPLPNSKGLPAAHHHLLNDNYRMTVGDAKFMKKNFAACCFRLHGISSCIACGLTSVTFKSRLFQSVATITNWVISIIILRDDVELMKGVLGKICIYAVMIMILLDLL